MKIITGLGNPGKEYQSTRHNVGFMVIDLLVKELGITDKWQKKFNALFLKSDDLVLLKPQTYMNLSGRAVRKAMDFYKVSAEDILIIHDDIDLQEGILKQKNSGGDGGNRGIRSIIEHLGTKDFSRIKIGIGHPGNKDKVSDYVLSKFEPKQETLDNAVNKIKEWLN